MTTMLSADCWIKHSFSLVPAWCDSLLPTSFLQVSILMYWFLASCFDKHIYHYLVFLALIIILVYTIFFFLKINVIFSGLYQYCGYKRLKWRMLNTIPVYVPLLYTLSLPYTGLKSHFIKAHGNQKGHIFASLSGARTPERPRQFLSKEFLMLYICVAAQKKSTVVIMTNWPNNVS